MLYQPLLPHLHKNPRDIKICMITTGADLEPDKTPISHIKTALQAWGMVNIHEYDIKGKYTHQLKNDLTEYDLFYMLGGNAFHLLRYMRLSTFDSFFPPLMSEGKIFIGEGAGAVVATPTLETYAWRHLDPQQEHTEEAQQSAMHLVPFLLATHYLPEQQAVIAEHAIQTPHPVVAISDHQGILAIGHKYHIFGEGEKITFNHFQDNLNQE